ncbi:hypothetical protein [Hansschlegelia sp. KR7-227]|uniref:hypothetical protein n=1 Tax=Hansschlegelia sp. KR7-227 TaxID=3400914 RepID=UPI003C1260A6
MPDSKKLVLIASQRSGTHAFGSVLARNGYLNFDEVFHPNDAIQEPQKSAQFKTFLNSDGTKAIEMLYEPETLTRRYFTHLDQFADGAPFYIDVKYNSLYYLNHVFYDGFSAPRLIADFRAAGFSFIHVVRRNAFERHLSAVIASATKQWHFDANKIDKSDVKSVRLEIDPGQCVFAVRQHMAAVQRVEGWLSQVPAKTTVYYEDMFADDHLVQAVVRQLRSTLGVTLEATETEYFKPDRSISDVVTNYGAVRKAMADAGFAWMTP